MSAGLVLLVFAVLLFLLLVSFVVVVQHGTFCITKKFGRLQRVLRPGFHLLYPFESLATISYTSAEESEDHIITFPRIISAFPTQPTKMDTPPVQANTTDGAQVTVNISIFWFVDSDGKEMTFLTSYASPFDFLSEVVRDAVVRTVGKHSVFEICSDVNKCIVPDIFASVRGSLKDSVLCVTLIAVQSIKFPAGIEDKFRDNSAQVQELHSREHKALIARKIAAEEAITAQECAQREAARERTIAVARAEGIRIVAEAETQRAGLLASSLIQAGVRPEDVADVINAQARLGLYSRSDSKPTVCVFDGAQNSAMCGAAMSTGAALAATSLK